MPIQQQRPAQIGDGLGVGAAPAKDRGIARQQPRQREGDDDHPNSAGNPSTNRRRIVASSGAIGTSPRRSVRA